MAKTLAQLRRDRYVDEQKIAAYQNLVSALSDERNAIWFYGALSTEARDAELVTMRARKKYELWRKK
jgi:hypothetical protein